MKLYFEDRYGRLREIADVETKDEVNSAIAEFLKQYRFTSYYTRYWITDGEEVSYITYDVGSHTEFFKLAFPSRDEAENFLHS